MKSVSHLLIYIFLISASLNAQPVISIEDSTALAPSFEFITLAGEKVSSDSLKGKIIVLDFWSSDCGPCIRSMPQMEIFYKKYKNDARVAVYLVNSGWESIEDAKSFAERKRKTFLFISYGDTYDLPFAYDSTSTTMKKFNLESNPSTIIIDAQFRIRVKHSGFIKDFYDFLNQHIEQLLTSPR